MTVLNAGPEPTETTSLLAHDVTTPALSDVRATVHSAVALENGVVDELQTTTNTRTLLEENADVTRKLYLVFPAVSLGVSTLSLGRV